jgi:hypothetical protein
VHPVQQVRARLPARRDPHDRLRSEAPRRGARGLRARRVQGQGARGAALFGAGRARRLHGLPPLRGRVPRQGQIEPAPQGARHGERRRPQGGRAPALVVLRGAPAARPAAASRST